MSFRLAVAQINLKVGDLTHNCQRIEAVCVAARQAGAHAIVFPELTLSAYPPEDLVLRRDFLEATARHLRELTGRVSDLTVILGYPALIDAVVGAGEQPLRVANAAGAWRNGQCLASYHKQHLPNYGVFDEARHFVPGHAPAVFDLHGIPVGITICEDVWHQGPVEQAVAAGARLILNLNASPWHQGKQLERQRAVAARVAESQVPVVYVNQIGGQDELVFDGHSFALDARGGLVFQGDGFVEGIYSLDVSGGGDGQVRLHAVADGGPAPDPVMTRSTALAEIYSALLLGIRDYVGKNGFSGAVLGLSGGIDSALTLALAVDALGAEKVLAVLMPSRYTAGMSIEDAQAQADTMGVATQLIPIEPVFLAFLDLLAKPLAGWPEDLTEENLQARCRGVLLMALSNKQRRILLTTGNKSEMSVGYATLYGDMAGGLAPLKDVSKLLVYALARYRNSLGAVIPDRVIERPPSAELRPDQRDDDSLPPYPVLDAILEAYIEQDASVADMIASGLPEVDVRRVIQLVDRSEFKRRQSPPGIRITRRAYGRERRYPMTNGFQP